MLWMNSLLAVPARSIPWLLRDAGLIFQGHRGNPVCAPLNPDRPVVAGLRDHDDCPLSTFPLENALAAQDEITDLVDPIGQKDHAAAFADMIQRILDRLGVVCSAVALGVKLAPGIGDATPVEIVGPRDFQGQGRGVGGRGFYWTTVSRTVSGNSL